MAERVTEARIVGRTFLREDSTGRFAAALDAGATSAVREMAHTLLTLVKGAISAMFRQRTGDLEGKVFAHTVSRQSAEVEAWSGHAAPLDQGARDHWIPNAFGSGVAVLWKGSGRSKSGYHFMRQAEEALTALAPEIIRRNMP